MSFRASRPRYSGEAFAIADIALLLFSGNKVSEKDAEHAIEMRGATEITPAAVLDAARKYVESGTETGARRLLENGQTYSVSELFAKAYDQERYNESHPQQSISALRAKQVRGRILGFIAWMFIAILGIQTGKREMPAQWYWLAMILLVFLAGTASIVYVKCLRVSSKWSA